MHRSHLVSTGKDNNKNLVLKVILLLYQTPNTNSSLRRTSNQNVDREGNDAESAMADEDNTDENLSESSGSVSTDDDDSDKSKSSSCLS
jgi:hypothetical protein